MSQSEIERLEANRRSIIRSRNAYRRELDEERARRIYYQTENDRMRRVVEAARDVEAFRATPAQTMIHARLLNELAGALAALDRGREGS